MFFLWNILIFNEVLKYTLRFTENGEVDIQLDVLFYGFIRSISVKIFRNFLMFSAAGL